MAPTEVDRAYDAWRVRQIIENPGSALEKEAKSEIKERQENSAASFWGMYKVPKPVIYADMLDVAEFDKLQKQVDQANAQPNG